MGQKGKERRVHLQDDIFKVYPAMWKRLRNPIKNIGCLMGKCEYAFDFETTFLVLITEHWESACGSRATSHILVLFPGSSLARMFAGRQDFVVSQRFLSCYVRPHTWSPNLQDMMSQMVTMDATVWCHRSNIMAADGEQTAGADKLLRNKDPVVKQISSSLAMEEEGEKTTIWQETNS